MTLEQGAPTNADKQRVYDFWNEAACGENLYLQTTDIKGYVIQSAERYRLEPFIVPFANFEANKGKKVLEIGVGLGADHQRFAEAEADLHGIDLTERTVAHIGRRLKLFGLSSRLSVGDAENLDFPDQNFDLVYSWGVLHHSPNTPKAIDEVFRVLKPGGAGKNHDLPYVEHDWSDALAAVCVPGRTTLAQP
jgi:SAM-dependent methyltransferase